MSRVDQLLARVAEELLRLRVRNDDAAHAVHDEHRVRCRFQQRPELLFGFPASRYIPDRAHDERVFIRVDRVKADLDGKLGAVLAAAIELGTGAHLTYARMREIAGPVSDMGLTEAVRHQPLDRRPAKLLTAVAEHVFGARVRDDDAAAAIDHHDAVGHRLEEPAKARFEPFRIAHDPEMRDILVCRKDPRDVSIGTMHRLAGDVDVNKEPSLRRRSDSYVQSLPAMTLSTTRCSSSV